MARATGTVSEAIQEENVSGPGRASAGALLCDGGHRERRRREQED